VVKRLAEITGNPDAIKLMEVSAIKAEIFALPR
jgi:hypothetical protein